jgi:cbb3-type cytochrome c oxidase subunit III
MKRMSSMIVGLTSVATALAFVSPAGARTRHNGAGRSSQKGSASGRQLFARNCARCHGAAGQGRNGPKLAGKSLDQQAIEQKVTDGGSKMPSFKKQLSSAQIKAVAAYVQSLGSRS